MPKVNTDPERPMSAASMRRWVDPVYAPRRPAKSFTTRHDRASHLRIFARTLHAQGYNPKPSNVRPKHVDAAVARWLENGTSPRTIENRLATLRWFGREIGKNNLLYRDNDAYLPRELYQQDIAGRINPYAAADLARVKDERIRASVALQQAFGLRRKESLMIRPTLADRGDRLVLEASWTKGGRPRDIPIVTQAQREALDAARRLAPGTKDSLIPHDRTYAQQRRLYDRQTAAAGLANLHRLRHAYAQDRYETLTRELDPEGRGWPAPVRGGPSRAQLKSPAYRAIDDAARLQISEELGHARIPITYVYLGY